MSKKVKKVKRHYKRKKWNEYEKLQCASGVMNFLSSNKSKSAKKVCLRISIDFKLFREGAFPV